MGYKVTHGFVTVPTAVAGGTAHIDIPRGAALPDDVPAEYVQTLLGRGHIEAVDDGPAVDVDGDGVPDASTAQVLAWVDSDAERAAQALEVENAKAEPRKGLVAELSKLIQTA